MNFGQIPLPAQPNVPASLADITNGAKLLDDLIESKRLARRHPWATNDDLSHARVYLHQLCESHAHQGNNAIPTLANIRAIVAEVLTESLTPINNKIDVLNGKVDRLLQMSAQAYNSGCGSGQHRNYQVIPFVNADGVAEDPATYNLPYLRTIDDINTLNQGDLHTYMDRYVIPRAGNIGLSTKILRLRVFLGCTVDE